MREDLAALGELAGRIVVYGCALLLCAVFVGLAIRLVIVLGFGA